MDLMSWKPCCWRRVDGRFNPPEWIGKLRPRVVLLSASAEDPRSQPDPEMLQAVAGYTLLRTDRNGWIETADGENVAEAQWRRGGKR
jgi:hypothetical protein